MKLAFKIRQQLIVIFIAAILAWIGTGFHAKAASSQCQLVYKLGEQYQTANTLGNLSSVKIMRNKQFFLKYPIGREQIAGSAVKIYVQNQAGDAEMIAKVICTSVNEDYYYDAGENCAYIPVSLKNEQGSIKLYFDITLANGEVKEKYEPGSGNFFCLDLLGEYTISYDANGGTDAPDSQTKYTESPLELTREEPIREGYIFKGWAESSAATEVSYHPGDMYTESRGKTLFAVWKLDLRPVVTGPADQSVKAGESAAFHVAAEGEHPDCYSYQWYYASSPDGTGTRLSGEVASSLVLAKDKVTPQLDNRYYYCVVYDSYSDEYVESSRARLTVNSEPAVTGPTAQSVKAGEAVSFRVAASGGKPSNYTYQWYYALSQSGQGIKIDGAVSQAYAIPGSQVTVSLNGRYYYCVVSNGIYYVTSSKAKLTVQANSVSGSNGDSGNDNGGNSNSGSNGGSNSNSGSNGNSSNSGGGSGNSNSTKARKTQKIKASSHVKEYGSKPFYLKAKSSGNGKLSYSSSNRKVASVSSKGKVTVKKYGTAVITIRASKTAKYRAASKKVKIKVVPKRAQIAKMKSLEKGMVTIIWKDNKTVTGYQVEIYYISKGKLKLKTKEYPRTQKGIAYIGIDSNTTCSVSIRSYVKVGKSKYYGPWSKMKKARII